MNQSEKSMWDQRILNLVNELNRRRVNMHSILITKDGENLYEEYREPFGPTQPHRLYSVTKSFVAMAIGCLLDEKKLALDDPIIRYFPDKLPTNVPDELRKQTIRHMLTMSTCFFGGKYWFQPGVTDRCAFYFAQDVTKPTGTLFNYDSNGSYVLGTLVERLSGMKLIEYMRVKFLNEIGGFENAEMLETPDGTPWADSALLCTTRAMERFARFVMQDGCWNGKQLISADYVRAAKTMQVTNRDMGFGNYNQWGYGYQIWMTEQGGFSFQGMGGQQVICIPDKKLIFVCTGDNQFNAMAGEILYDAVFDHLSPDEKVYRSPAHCMVQDGMKETALSKEISGKWFACNPNPSGITKFRLKFDGDEGCFEYENAQGEKKLPFGIGKNVFGKFPQRGYSNGRGNVHDENDPFLLGCAASAAWVDEKTLMLFTQIIDRYFGTLIMTFGFRGKDVCGFRMVKNAEDFLQEYNGTLFAYMIPDQH